MEGILLVCSSEKGRAYLAELLRQMAVPQIHMAKSGSQARRFLIQGQAPVVIVNTPLTDEFGKEFALFAAELADEISHEVEEEGILIVEKPMSKALFLQAVKLSMAAQRRMRGLQHENDRLQQKIQEIRLVDRAKCLLIERENMAEGQAHRFIEKQAMDQRKTRAEVARDVLRRYDLDT